MSGLDTSGQTNKPSDRVTVLCICPGEVAPPDRGR
nr:MAG TPA: Low molecular weight phosphotyrosine protein-PTP, Inhibitor, Complex, hydrolase-hydrolase inhibitor [Caudoviricetes sp.]DAT62744.1 MAG TPA: Low molecular weight phosphotyrosine protein-PTP, Inhibitor, Complex, hydrolase-hydrolase inhibitor [Caudoviricetes sp.]